MFFDLFSMFFLYIYLGDSIIRNAKEWYKKSQYNTTVSPIVFYFILNIISNSFRLISMISISVHI